MATVQIALDNVRGDAEIRAVLQQYGYDEDRLAEGRQLHVDVLALQRAQEAAHGDACTAQHAASQSRLAARATYGKHAKHTRVVLHADPGLLLELGLICRRERGLHAWIAQANKLYTAALSRPDLVRRLTVAGLTQAMLEDGKRKVWALETAATIVKRTSGLTPDATDRRDSTLHALDVWFREFVALARVAFAERPGRLHQLGIGG